QAFGDDGVGDVFHGQRSDQFPFAFATGRLNDVHVNFLEAGSCEERWQARTDVRVNAPAPRRFHIELHIAPEGGGVRIAEVAGEVDVFEHNDAAGTQGCADVEKSLRRIGEVSQYEAGVNEVEFAGGSGVHDVREAKFDVGEMLLGGF